MPMECPAEELKKELISNDAETRGIINGGVSSQLVSKCEEGKQKVFGRFYRIREVTGDGEPLGWHKIHFAYDSNNHLVEVKDDFGARMRYDYDCLGNPVLEERVIEEGVIQRIRYGYNKNGWKIWKTEEIQGNDDLKTAVTRYGYDENGNLNWIKTPKGFEIRRNYDGDDHLIEERVLDKRNGIDRRTCYAYDAAGNLLSVIIKGKGRRA